MEPIEAGRRLTSEVVDRYARPGPRYTSYPPIPFWDPEVGETDYRDALARAGEAKDEPLALYVHLPFCAARCAYCGCNATVTNRQDVVDAYLDRVVREIGMVEELVGQGRAISQLHLGGGTPNFLTEAQMARLWETLDRTFDMSAANECSLEIDPRIATPEQVSFYRSLGFDRISLGVQDVDPKVQEAIGRVQPESLTREIYGAARKAGFRSVNLDLVYGLPFQTPEVFNRTLDVMVELRPDRLACFSYAHLPHLRPNQKQVDASGLPETPWEKMKLFRLSVERLTEAGWTWIGMDHFALDEDEMAIALRERRLHRNFMGYVERPTPHLVAFGCSGIGEVAGLQAQTEVKLGRYQKSIDAGSFPIVRGHRLTDDDRRRRKAIYHLLCNLELPSRLLDASVGESGEHLPALEASREGLDRCVREGLLEEAGDGYRVSGLGRWFLRNVCMELDAYLPRTSEPKVDGPSPRRFSMTV